MKIGAVYIRVSTDDQTEYSPDAQLKRIKEYAKKNNILVTKEFTFIENGISGRSVEKRIEFKRMISIAKRKPKPFDVVLVHAYDRFARNVKESRIYKELLRNDLGIELISVTEDFGNDKNSFLMEGIKDILNEYYSLNLSDEVLKGMSEKASRGELQTAASFGYRAINNKLEIYKPEADVVKMIFNKYINDNVGFLDIARELNKLGIKTKRGKNWENKTVKYVIQNPVYIGYMRWQAGEKKDYSKFNINESIELIKGKHDAIISKELWDKAQDKIKLNHTFSKPHQVNSNICWHWMKGLIKCAECGHTYTRATYTGHKIRCNGYAKGKCTNNVKLSVNDLENIILDNLKDTFKKKIDILVTKRKRKENFERDILLNQLELMQNKKERIKESYIAGIDTLEEYKQNKEMITKEEEKIKKELSCCKDNSESLDNINEIRINSENVYNLLKNPKIENSIKKIAVNNLLDKVEINPKTKEISIYYNY